MAAERIFAVIEVDRFQAVQPDHTVKFLQHIVQMIHDIISAVADMAGVETDAELFLPFGAVDDLPQLFKAAPDLAAFARHGLQQNRRVLFRRQNAVEQLRDQPDARFYPLLDMAARVTIIISARDRFQPPEVILHDLKCKVARMLVRRTGIERIRRMRHNHRDPVFRSKADKGRFVRRVGFFCRKTARIARKKLKRICTDRNGLLPHMQIPLGG